MAGRPNSRHPKALTIASRLRIAAALAGVLASACVPAAPAQPAPRDAEAIEAGRKLFIRCVACHTRSAASRPGTGPHLEGIVGRPVASVPGFNYSSTLKAQSFVWTRQKLNQWLRKPQEHFPGMCVPFAGFARKADRQALIAYLESPAT